VEEVKMPIIPIFGGAIGLIAAIVIAALYCTTSDPTWNMMVAFMLGNVLTTFGIVAGAVLEDMHG
jgi:hypothetical protein